MNFNKAIDTITDTTNPFTIYKTLLSILKNVDNVNEESKIELTILELPKCKYHQFTLAGEDIDFNVANTCLLKTIKEHLNDIPTSEDVTKTLVEFNHVVESLLGSLVVVVENQDEDSFELYRDVTDDQGTVKRDAEGVEYLEHPLTPETEELVMVRVSKSMPIAQKQILISMAEYVIYTYVVDGDEAFLDINTIPLLEGILSKPKHYILQLGDTTRVSSLFSHDDDADKPSNAKRFYTGAQSLKPILEDINGTKRS